MIILIDTDVLINVALDRRPRAATAGALLDALEQRRATAFVAWPSVANFYYLVTPSRGRADAKQFVLDLIEFADVAPTNTECLRRAATMEMKDFEDAVQVAAALACGADMIATRNTKGYSRSPVKAATPATVLPLLSEP